MQKRVSKSKRRYTKTKSLGGYRRTRRHLIGRRSRKRCSVGGVPLSNLRQPMIRLPHTRQNIIRGYAREMYDDVANQQQYIQALNEHLARDGFPPVTNNELDTTLQYIQSIMTQ
jgi:RecA-family ATPase